MRMARLIITTLLALQLFVTTGLCAGVCCSADSKRAEEEVAVPQAGSKQVESESKPEGGHCPLHAGKPEKPKSQTNQPHSPNSSRQSFAARTHGIKSSAAVEARFCSCHVEREEQPDGVLSQRSFKQRPAVQAPPGAPHSLHGLIDMPRPQLITSRSFRSHSPPFSGSQLILRI